MKRNVLIISFLLVAFGLFGQSADEIIKKMEANQVHRSSYSEGSMEIEDEFGKRVKTFKSYSEGSDKMLLEFTNIEEEGQKILRLDDEIYLFFPDAEEVVYIQGNALKDKVMGSDFSYEDMTGNKGLLAKYKATLEGEETIDGAVCYKIVLTAIVKEVVYPKQIMWVDKELLSYRRVHSFALSGKLLKEMDVKKFSKIAGKNIPVLFEMKDAMKKDSKTVFKTTDLEVDVELDDYIFSLEELSW